MKVTRLSWTAVLLLLTLLSACGGSEEKKTSSPTPVISMEEKYQEGTVKMGIETLDTGLLKGHSFADAAQDWSIEQLMVSAQDDKGTTWQVIEIPESKGSQKASEFFEVVVQELPRGHQLTITTSATFSAQSGEKVERTAQDRWPP